MNNSVLKTNMTNLIETVGLKAAETYFFTIKVNEDISLHFTNSPFAKTKEDCEVQITVGSKFGLSSVPAKHFIRTLQSIYHSTRILKLNKKYSKAKRYRYIGLEACDDSLMNQAFDFYGLVGLNSTFRNKKIRKELKSTTIKTKSPAPVKLKFKESQKYISITKNELKKVIETLENLDSIIDFVYEYRFKNLFESQGIKLGQNDNLLDSKRFQQGVKGYYNGFELFQLHSSDFIEKEFGEPSFQDDVVTALNPDHPECGKFYSKQVFDGLVYKLFANLDESNPYFESVMKKAIANAERTQIFPSFE